MPWYWNRVDAMISGMSSIGYGKKIRCTICGKPAPYWSDWCAQHRLEKLGYTSPNKPKGKPKCDAPASGARAPDPIP